MRNRVLKLAVLASSASAIVLATGLTAADATRTVRIASHISIGNENLTFGGRVTASNAACEGNRKVTLYRKRSQVLGSTHTNAHGHWSVTPSGFAGISLSHFYAVVSRRSEGTAGTIYVCKGATSRTTVFQQ
jgi:hypothetical protein